MSILDENAPDILNKNAEEGLNFNMRLLNRQYRFSRAIDACSFVSNIQEWLCDHWIYQGCWETVKFDDSLLQSLREEGQRLCVMPDISRLSDKYLNPKDEVSEMIYLEMKDKGPGNNPNITICECNAMKMMIKMPRVKILNTTPTGMASGIVARKIISVMWGQPSILTLTNVEGFPPHLGQWEGRLFRWRIPVDKVYLWNCPKIDPRILTLPYVETFEQHNWLV